MTSMLLTERYDLATPGAAVVAVSVAAVMDWNGYVRANSTSPLGWGEPQHDPHPNPLPQAGEGRAGRMLVALGFLASVAWSDVLFLGIRGRGLLDHRPHQLAIGLDPMGDHLPLVAVPLLEFDCPATFVIGAGDLERLHEPGGAELL